MLHLGLQCLTKVDLLVGCLSMQAFTHSEFAVVAPLSRAIDAVRHAPSCYLPVQAVASPVPQLAISALLKHLRSVLISLISYEFQTPLSILQAMVETLAEGDSMPAQVQRRVLALAQAEFTQMCDSVDYFLASINQLWSLTLEYLQNPSNLAVRHQLRSMLSVLLTRGEDAQPWIGAQTSLTAFEHLMDTFMLDDIHRPFLPEQLEQFEEEKRCVLAVVSHELRTPLTALKICLDILHAQAEDSIEFDSDLLAIAGDDLTRLRVLVRDLELLYRLEAGRVCFKTESVDLRPLLQASLSGVLSQVSTETADVSIEATAHLSTIWVDGDRLVEVFTRLIDNACRFTEATGTIKVQACLSDASLLSQRPCLGSSKQSILKICVSDSGRGIATEQVERIFECFHQEEQYLRRTMGGIGVGLSICRYLVEGMGGQIWAESSNQQSGAQICFILPITQDTSALIG